MTFPPKYILAAALIEGISQCAAYLAKEMKGKSDKIDMDDIHRQLMVITRSHFPIMQRMGLGALSTKLRSQPCAMPLHYFEDFPPFKRKKIEHIFDMYV